MNTDTSRYTNTVWDVRLSQWLTIQMNVFCHLASCSTVDCYWHFTETSFLQLLLSPNIFSFHRKPGFWNSCLPPPTTVNQITKNISPLKNEKVSPLDPIMHQMNPIIFISQCLYD